MGPGGGGGEAVHHREGAADPAPFRIEGAPGCRHAPVHVQDAALEALWGVLPEPGTQTVLTASGGGGRAPSQERTCGSASALATSDSTLVSMRKAIPQSSTSRPRSLARS